MSAANHLSNAVASLRKLGRELAELYPDAGEKLGRAIGPVEVPIIQIGIPWSHSHFAENWQRHIAHGMGLDRARQEAQPHPYAFAEEETLAGSIEYALCVARGRDGKCSLRVSVCEYVVAQTERKDSNGNVISEAQLLVEPKRFVAPGEVPLGARVKILNVLDKFVADYEVYVRKTRAELLDGSCRPTPTNSKQPL